MFHLIRVVAARPLSSQEGVILMSRFRDISPHREQVPRINERQEWQII